MQEGCPHGHGSGVEVASGSRDSGRPLRLVVACFTVSAEPVLLLKSTGRARLWALGLSSFWKGFVYFFISFFLFWRSVGFVSMPVNGLHHCSARKEWPFPAHPYFQIFQYPKKGLLELQGPLVSEAPWACWPLQERGDCRAITLRCCCLESASCRLLPGFTPFVDLPFPCFCLVCQRGGPALPRPSTVSSWAT